MQNIDWSTCYQKKLAQLGYVSDPAQLMVMDLFAEIESQLTDSKAPTTRHENNALSLFKRLRRPRETQNQATPTLKGLYCYGDVGRGKTFLMDIFCENSAHRVRRLHFHHFMHSIHQQLKTITQQSDPLQLVAQQIAQDVDVLCIDEFFVSDITDAMILYTLLQSLFANGVLLVTTSNIAPDALYQSGLQRARFLPAIELIKSALHVYHIADGKDFRRDCLAGSRHFFTPHDQVAQHQLETHFQTLSAHLQVERDGMIELHQRGVSFIARSSEVIWFDFATLCQGNRAAMDYIALASDYPCLMVSDIPVLDQYQEEAAKRFLLLIDELYDRRVALLLSSACPIEEIYTGDKMRFEFSRLKSRLFEMQSESYWHYNKRSS